MGLDVLCDGRRAFVNCTRDTLINATRHRRRLGGAMRQVGIFAAAGMHALEHQFDRLAEDHLHARSLATNLAQSARIVIDLDTVQTNIVVFTLADDAPDAATLVARARERGVLVLAFGPRTVRAVTHLDVSGAQCERAARILAGLAEDRWEAEFGTGLEDMLDRIAAFVAENPDSSHK